MASPFESAREPASLEAGERARLDQANAVSAVTPPAATTEIQQGLDSTTRESLSRLALLIRAQLKAVEPTLGSAVSEAEVDAHKNSNPEGDSEQKRDEKKREAEEALKARFAAGSGEIVPVQAAPDAFPAIGRMERRFEQASRERGSRIYSQQKSKDAVQSILGELERRHAHIHLENAHELLIPIPSSTRRAA